MKFRKKLVVIEAEQFSGTPIDGVCFENGLAAHSADGPHVHTLEGWLKVSLGDWIIKGVKGEYYPCKPDIFEATYDKLCKHEIPADKLCDACEE